MLKFYHKPLTVLTCIVGLAFSSVSYAGVSAMAKLAKTPKISVNTARAVGRINSIKHVTPAFKPVAASSFKPAVINTSSRPTVMRSTRAKPIFVPKNARQLKNNQQRLAIQTNVKKSVDLAKKNLGIKAPASLKANFNSNANPGIIYRRKMGKNVYIGQTKNLKRYPKRQLEHTRKLKKEMGAKFKKPSFQIVAGAPGNNAKLLRVAEEAAYRTQKRFGAKLTNKVKPMANRKYLSAIGR